MRFEKIAAVSAILFMGVAGAVWHYSATEFEKIADEAIRNIGSLPTVRLGNVTISKYLFKMTIKDVSLTSSKETAYTPFALRLSTEFDMSFNPLSKTTTLSTTADYHADIDFGNFKESLKGTTRGHQATLVLVHNSYPTSRMTFNEMLKTIAAAAVEFGPGDLKNAEGNLIYKTQGGEASSSWSLTPDQKLTVKLDSDMRGVEINETNFINLILGFATQIPGSEEFQKEMRKMGGFILPKSQVAHLDLALDYGKIKSTLVRTSDVSALSYLKSEDIPDMTLNLSLESQYQVAKGKMAIHLVSSKNGQMIDISDTTEYPGDKVELAKWVFDYFSKWAQANNMPITLQKEAFVSGFPDIAKAGPINYSFHFDGQLNQKIRVNKGNFEFKTNDCSIEGQVTGSEDSFSGDVKVLNYKKFIDGLADVSHWAANSVVDPSFEVKKTIESAVPFYQKTALFILEKVGEPKPSAVDATFHIEGSSKLFKINGKTIEEWVPVVLMGGLMGGVSSLVQPSAEPDSMISENKNALN